MNTEQTNMVGWFEIPTQDLARAKQFYKAVFNTDPQDMEMAGRQMAIFSGDPQRPGASGALVHSPHDKPQDNGTLVYFGTPDIDATLQKVVSAGGKQLLPKTEIGQWGHIGFFLDSEGNRVALWSR